MIMRDNLIARLFFWRLFVSPEKNLKKKTVVHQLKRNKTIKSATRELSLTQDRPICRYQVVNSLEMMPMMRICQLKVSAT